MTSPFQDRPSAAHNNADLAGSGNEAQDELRSIQLMQSVADDDLSLGSLESPEQPDEQLSKAMVKELSMCEYASLSGKDRREVEMMFQTLIKRYPRWHHARYCFGLHYLPVSPSKAAAQLVEAEKLAPADMETKMALVQAYMKLHHYGLASSVVKRALTLSPEHKKLAQLAVQIDRKSTDVF